MTVDDAIFAPGRNAISRNVSPELLGAIRAMPPGRIAEYRQRDGLVGYSFSTRAKGKAVEVTAWWFDSEPVSATGKDILEATSRAEAALAKQRAGETL